MMATGSEGAAASSTDLDTLVRNAAPVSACSSTVWVLGIITVLLALLGMMVAVGGR